MPFQVGFLDKGAIAVPAVKRTLSAVHADMGFHAEEFGVGSTAIGAFEELVGPVCDLIACENLFVTSVHAVTVLHGRKDLLVVGKIRINLIVLKVDDVVIVWKILSVFH